MNINCFSISDLEKVFTLDVYEKDPITFLETHLELDKIYVKLPGVQVFEQTTEQEIIKQLLSDKTISGPRIFIIVGDAGTGKSELCRLITETAKNSGKYVVDHKHKGLLAFGPLAFIGKEEIIYNLLKGLNYEEVLNLLLLACRTLLERQNYGELWDRIKGRVRDGIRNRLIETARSAERFRKEPEVEIKPFMLIESEDFRPFLKKEESEKLVKVLNTRLANILIALYSDFTSITSLITHRVQESSKLGKRYLLVMDDITLLGETFADILNLVTYIGQGGLNCDVVLGITRGRYRDLSRILDTLSDRAYEIQLTNPNLAYINAFWLLDETLAMSLIKKYVKAIKDRNRCSLCKSKICKKISSEGLFPFNESFIKNYYRWFRELAEKGSIALTPRFLLATLKNSLMYFLEDGKSPANRICQEWENVEGFIDPAGVWLPEEAPKWMRAFIRTCYFYGEVSREEEVDRIKIEKAIVELFKFDIEAIKKYLQVNQDGPYLIITREREKIRARKTEGAEEKVKTINLDEVLSQTSRWMRSPNIPFEYTPDIREGFNKLLAGVFKNGLRLILNQNRLSMKGVHLEWKHRKEDVFPFSIGFSKEKNEIKLIPNTLSGKERDLLTIYVDKEGLIDLIKLKYFEDTNAALKFIAKHPELIAIGRRCREISFSQAPYDFFEWILASIIVLNQIRSSLIIEKNTEGLYQIFKKTLSQKFDDPLLNKLRLLAFSIFTVRDSIIDYILVRDLLTKLADSNLLSIVLQFDHEKVGSIGSAANIVQEVQNFVEQKIRSADEEKVLNRAKKYLEYAKLAKEVLEDYQNVKSELERLNILRPERYLILPKEIDLKEFIDDSNDIEVLTKKGISKLETLILSNKIEEMNKKHRGSLEFLIKIDEICSRSETTVLEKYRKLVRGIETLEREIEKLIENILNLLGE